MREICQMFDRQIMILDELIAELEAQNRNNPLNVRRREKGKRSISSLMEEKSKEIPPSIE